MVNANENKPIEIKLERRPGIGRRIRQQGDNSKRFLE